MALKLSKRLEKRRSEIRSLDEWLMDEFAKEAERLEIIEEKANTAAILLSQAEACCRGGYSSISVADEINELLKEWPCSAGPLTNFDWSCSWNNQ